MESKGMSIAAKNKLAYITAIVTVIFAIMSGVLIYCQSDNVYPLILGIGALIYGPICLILYIIELVKGVMKADVEEEEEEEL